MASRESDQMNQLSLDFDSVANCSNFGHKPNTSPNVVSFEDAVNLRSEYEKKEILSLIADYAKKLNW
jgi:predicted metal-binding protein